MSAYTRFPFSKIEEFREAERDAREEGRGLWAEAEPPDAASGSDPDASTPGCIPREQCCKVCRKGRACVGSCIRASYTCRKGRGCACDAAEVCP